MTGKMQNEDASLTSEWDTGQITEPVCSATIEAVRQGTSRFVIVDVGDFSLNVQLPANDRRTRGEVLRQLASAILVAAEDLDGE